MSVDLFIPEATEAEFGSPEPVEDRGALPESLRLLCLCDGAPSWVGLAMQLDAAGCHAPRFHHETTVAAVVGRVREETFDAILIVGLAPNSVAPAIASLRTAGFDEPLVVVRDSADDELVRVCCRHDADLVVTTHPWSSRAIVPTLARARERHAIESEHHRLHAEHVRRVERDRNEATRILHQQQSLIAGLASTNVSATGDADVRETLTRDVGAFYQNLLRTHVIMGTGALGDEIGRIAETLAEAGIGPREALELHLGCVERLVRGLGNRSTGHVVGRANLLALELVVQLGERLRTAA